MMSWWKFISCIVVGIFFLAFFNLFLSKIIHPAYISYQFDCEIIPNIMYQMNITHFYDLDVGEIEFDGYILGGAYDGSSGKIYTYYQDDITKAHEICHRLQHEKGRFHDCNDNFLFFKGVFLNEVECYIGQYFIDPNSPQYDNYEFVVTP